MVIYLVGHVSYSIQGFQWSVEYVSKSIHAFLTKLLCCLLCKGLEHVQLLGIIAKITYGLMNRDELEWVAVIGTLNC